MKFLNNECDRVVYQVDCTKKQYDKAEAVVLNSNRRRQLFCGNLYFADVTSKGVAGCKVVDMTLNEYVAAWKPFVEWYDSNRTTPFPATTFIK